MEKDRIDRTFRDKVDGLTGLPPDVKWSSNTGWSDYSDLYPAEKNSGRKIILYISSMAAALLLIIFTVLYFQKLPSETEFVNNNTDKVMKVVLPDGNEVWLNKSSTFEYPSVIDKIHNEFTVEGEVYFEIRKLDNPVYKIMAHNAVILSEIPGSFNIRARKDEDNVNITVASGALKIMEESYTEGLALLVTEGNNCSVHKSQNLVYTSANRNENYLAWKTGKLIFNDIPMSTVTDVLAEFYHTRIELEDKSLAYCLFSGTFRNQPIGMILQRMQADHNFVIINTGDRIMISGKGCL